MHIYPVIDILDGNCVRLHGGDYNASTIYNSSPVDTAQVFEKAGAEWLHLIDLEGARNPACRQKDLVSMLIEKSGLKIQTGGGVRTAADVDELIGMGAHRVIVGSLSVKNPRATKMLLDKHGPEKIVLAFDVKGGFVATYGWKTISDTKLEDILEIYRGLAKHVICTDISRDGKLGGVNIEFYEYLMKSFPGFAFQASGGVSTLKDVGNLKSAGVSGVIIGKALYENRFTLSEALKSAA